MQLNRSLASGSSGLSGFDRISAKLISVHPRDEIPRGDIFGTSFPKSRNLTRLRDNQHTASSVINYLELQVANALYHLILLNCS